MLQATALVPLWDRAAEWQRRLAMVEAAQSFLYLSTFYIEHDAYGTAILAALKRAVQRGVAVTLVVDAFGQRLGGVLMTAAQRADLAREMKDLRALGGSIGVYAPPHLVQRLLGGGQHVKIQVSEAGEAVVGSSNLTKTSFEAWNEYAVALRGPIVATVLESLRAFGGAVSPAHVAHLRAEAVAEAAPANLSLDYWYCNPNATQSWTGPFGWRGENDVTNRMIEMLDSARRSAQVTSFYFKPVAPLFEAVVRAARRGVHVEVFHSHREALPATDLPWIAAAASYPTLLEAGVQLFENRHGEHSKLVLIDDAWAAFGSYNFEDAAHDRLGELMLASRDRRAVEPIEAIFDLLRRDPDNVRVNRDWFSELPPRVATRVARYGRFKWWM